MCELFYINCVDGNDYNNYKAVMIVKQPPYLMVPVKLEGQWFNDYALKVLYEFNGLIFSLGDSLHLWLWEELL